MQEKPELGSTEDVRNIIRDPSSPLQGKISLYIEESGLVLSSPSRGCFNSQERLWCLHDIYASQPIQCTEPVFEGF